MFPGDVIQDRFQRSAETKVHYPTGMSLGATARSGKDQETLGFYWNHEGLL